MPDERPGVALVTDSTSYLPRSLIERWTIREVSLYVGWEGDLRPEHQYDDLDAFYARLRESPLLPTTSQTSVGDFVACFEPLVGAEQLELVLGRGESGADEHGRHRRGQRPRPRRHEPDPGRRGPLVDAHGRLGKREKSGARFSR